MELYIKIQEDQVGLEVEEMVIGNLQFKHQVQVQLILVVEVVEQMNVIVNLVDLVLLL